jgi:tRNA (guanine-N1)-methyltransferase
MRRALNEKKIGINVHNIREYALDKHRMTDDRPFGGGEGMVMKPEPLAACVRAVVQPERVSRVILLSPKGEMFSQEQAGRLAGYDQLVLICGRYEGVDQRFLDRYVEEELSIGDYILTGGELAALVVIDAVCRLLPGVLGCSDSAANDSFSCGLLKHAQYTRPRVFEEMAVPDVLLSGDHAAVERWRLIESVRLTLARRPEMLVSVRFSPLEEKILRREGVYGRIESLVKAQRAGGDAD